MPEQYEIQAAMPTQELDATTGRLVDVMEATGITKPHNVNFTVRVTKSDGWRDRLLAAAAAEAREIESLWQE